MLALGIWRAPLLILAYLYQIDADRAEPRDGRRAVAGGGGAGHRAAGRRPAAGVRAAGGGHRACCWSGWPWCWPATAAWPARAGSRPGTITWAGRWRRRWSMVPVCLVAQAVSCAAGGRSAARVTYVADVAGPGRAAAYAICGERAAGRSGRPRPERQDHLVEPGRPARRRRNRDATRQEVADEVLHGHHVLRGAQLRRRRRVRRSALPGTLPPRPRGPRLLLRRRLQRRPRRPSAPRRTRRRRACTSTRSKSRYGILSPLATQATGLPWFKAEALREALDDPDTDVVHFHNISLVGGPGVLGLGANRRAVRIMTAHEHWLICPMHLLWKYDRKPCDAPELRALLPGRRPAAAGLAADRRRSSGACGASTP